MRQFSIIVSLPLFFLASCKTSSSSNLDSQKPSEVVQSTQISKNDVVPVSVLNPEAMDVELDEFPEIATAAGPVGNGPKVLATSAAPPACYRSIFDLDPNIQSKDAAKNAYWMAVAARIAYDPEQDVRDFLSKKAGMSFMTHLEASSWSYDTQGFFAIIEKPSSRAAILSFRGTNEKIDYFTDSRSSPVAFYGIDANGQIDKSNFLGNVHQGFASALDSVWPDIYKSAVSLKGKVPIFITGHSMGGAIATLASARLLTQPKLFNVHSVFTFGSPRVGGVQFSDSIYKLTTSKTRMFRFVNNDDVVAVVPSLPNPRYLPMWWHVGELNWFDASGNLFSNQDANSRASSTIWTKNLSLSWASDHKITNYLPRVEKYNYGNMSECQ